MDLAERIPRASVRTRLPSRLRYLNRGVAGGADVRAVDGLSATLHLLAQRRLFTRAESLLK